MGRVFAAVAAAFLLVALGLPNQEASAHASAGQPARSAGIEVLQTHPSLKNKLKHPRPKAARRHALNKDEATLKQAKKKADTLASAHTAAAPKSTPRLPATASQFNGLSGDGLADNDWSPSDSTGDIGPMNYIEMVNSKIGVYDRNLYMLDSTSLAAFGAIGPLLPNPQGSCVFDPQIAWDQQANRWLYSMVEQTTSTTSCSTLNNDYLDFGWSMTSNPLGGWCGYAINSGPVMDDYDKLGHDNNFIIIGANAFGNYGDESQFLGAEIWAINKPATGSTTCPSVPSVHLFGRSIGQPDSLVNDDGSPATTPVPAEMTDASPVGYVVAARDPGTVGGGSIATWHIGSNAGTPTLTQDPAATVPTYFVPPSVQEPITLFDCSYGYCLDSGDGRLTQAIAHYDPAAGGETIWTQHAISDPNVGTLSIERWYELKPGLATPRQTGVISNPNLYVFNGAVSPTTAGNQAVIFYNTAGPVTGGFVDYRAQRRNSATPLGAMGGEVIIASSTAIDADFTCGVSMPPPQNGIPCRWGDYASARPDPLNANTVWGTGMIVNQGGGSIQGSGWATKIARMTSGCLSASVSSQPTVQRGETVLFTASATDCGNPLYEFWLRNPNGAWALKQAFSPTNTWTWDTLGYSYGTSSQLYPVTVWVTDAGDAQTTWDTYAQGGSTLLKPVSCAQGVVGGAPGSPVPAGTQINLTASVGPQCSTPVYEYWTQAPGGGWTIVRPYSTDPAFGWNTAGLVPGVYHLSVWMEQRGGSTSTYETYAAATVTLTGCATAGVTPSVTSPQTVGTAVTLNAVGGGCLSPLFQFWLQAPGGSYQIVQPYSSNGTFNWATAANPAGTYHFSVWVKDSASGGASGGTSGRWDTYATLTFVLTSTPCTSVSASTSTAGPVTTISASAVCPNPLYQFWMQAPGSTSWLKVQPYGPGSTYDFDSTGKAKGTYHFSIWARDTTSVGTSFNSSGRWDAYTTSTVVVT